MASPNATFTELVTTTARHRKRTVADNVTNHNAAWTQIKKKGNIKSYGGGSEIVLPITHAENGTFSWYHGADVLDVEQSDSITAAKFDPKQASIFVTATGREIRQNSSKEKMLDLVKTRTDVAYATAANQMNSSFYSDGSVSNELGGLQQVVNSVGTNTVGGIDASVHSFWANKVKELTGPTVYATVRSELNLLYMSLVRGMDKPDISIWTHDLYAVFEGGLQDNQRYASADLAKVGFETLMFKNVPVWFDSDSTSFATTGETIYMLSTKFVHIKEHPAAKWDIEEKRTPTQQDIIVQPLFWMGNMCTDGRKFQGRAHDLA